jgi:hypothetical protein
MTKARILADFISDGSSLADGTISVAEVSGAAPLASPTFTGTVTGTAASFTRLDINASNTKLKGDLFAYTDAAYDIGASGANRPRNLYLSSSITAGDITTTGAGVASFASGAVFNENSYDADFRVESDGNTHALFVDASVDRVGVGAAPMTNGSTFQVTSDSTEANNMQLTLRGASDTNKQMVMGFDTTANTAHVTTQIAGSAPTPLIFKTGNVVFNEASSDSDFRVESDANDHMLFVDGGNNRVSINSNSTSYDSAAPLHIGPNSTYSYGPNIQGTVNRTYVHYIGAGGGSGNNVYIHGYQVDNPAGGNYLRVASGLAGNAVSGVQQSQDGIIYVYDTGKTTGDADYTPTVQHRIDLNSGGSVVFNDQGLDLDFRVESDNNANMFYIDAGMNKAAFGAAPQTAIGGMVQTSSLSVGAGTYAGYSVYVSNLGNIASNTTVSIINFEGPTYNRYMKVTISGYLCRREVFFAGYQGWDNQTGAAVGDTTVGTEIFANGANSTAAKCGIYLEVLSTSGTYGNPKYQLKLAAGSLTGQLYDVTSVVEFFSQPIDVTYQ